jgi:hypothetical protein
MRRQQLDTSQKQKSKGQSLIELTLVFFVIMTLLVGMVEFGNLLNQYITVTDAAREGARFASNDDPFAIVDVNGVQTSNYEIFFGKIYQVIQGEYNAVGEQISKGALNPIVLSDENGDDIVVSFFSVITNKAGAKALAVGNPDTGHRFVSAAGSKYNNQESKFSDTDILNMVSGNAPSAGVLLVEIFYNYHQILKLGSFLKNADGSGVMDPILVHAYSIMPLSAAEPTPTPP